MAHPQFRINLLATERAAVEALIRTHSTAHVVARRARNMLLANGASLSKQENPEIAETMRIFKVKHSHRAR